MPSLGNGHISHQEVRGQVAGGEGVVGGLQQREAGHAAGAALLLADHQPVGVETPARVQVKVQNLEEMAEKRREERVRGGEDSQEKGLEGREGRGQQKESLQSQKAEEAKRREDGAGMHLLPLWKTKVLIRTLMTRGTKTAGVATKLHRKSDFVFVAGCQTGTHHANHRLTGIKADSDP